MWQRRCANEPKSSMLKRPHDGAATYPGTGKRAAYHSTDVQPVSPPSTPRAGDTMVALQLAKVRSGCEMTSPEAGQLLEGAKITVVDTATNESGVLRIKFEQENVRGWVSVTSGSGEAILEQSQAEESQVLNPTDLARSRQHHLQFTWKIQALNLTDPAKSRQHHLQFTWKIQALNLTDLAKSRQHHLQPHGKSRYWTI